MTPDPKRKTPPSPRRRRITVFATGLTILAAALGLAETTWNLSDRIRGLWGAADERHAEFELTPQRSVFDLQDLNLRIEASFGVGRVDLLIDTAVQDVEVAATEEVPAQVRLDLAGGVFELTAELDPATNIVSVVIDRLPGPR